MNAAVKEFIEYNIEVIEQGNWHELFLNWYAYRKDYYFDDMMDVLEVAIPDIWTLTWEARADMLRELATYVFANLSNKNKRVTFEAITSELNSLFGFEGQDLIYPIPLGMNIAECKKGKKEEEVGPVNHGSESVLITK